MNTNQEALVFFLKMKNRLIPSELTSEFIEAVYEAGAAHGLFSDSNYGIDDKRNSVVALLLTVRDIK